VAIFIALLHVTGLCIEHGSGCVEGEPSLELVSQLVLALVIVGAAIGGRVAVHYRLYTLAGAICAAGVLLFTGWALVLDAAVRGWEELRLL
jgi:hypothetical protein